MEGHQRMPLDIIRESKWSFIIIIPCVVAADLFIMATPYLFCFSSMVAAGATVGIPYFFGKIRVKDIIKIGIISLIIASLIHPFLSIDSAYSAPLQVAVDDRPASERALEGGTVTPYAMANPTDFNFTVEYVGPANATVTLYVNVTEYLSRDSVNLTMTPTLNASRTYYAVTTLDDGIYGYVFLIEVEGGNESGWNHTTEGFGPIALTQGAFAERTYGTYFVLMLMYYFTNVGFIMLLMCGLIWITRKNKREQQKWKDEPPPPPKERRPVVGGEEGDEVEDAPGDGDGAGDEGVPGDGEVEENTGNAGQEATEGTEGGKTPASEGEFECDECGATVKASDDVCPGCGDTFED